MTSDDPDSGLELREDVKAVLNEKVDPSTFISHERIVKKHA